jgi:hypothetical protein
MLDRLVDERARQSLVLEAVELEPAGAVRRRIGDLRRSRRGDRRERHHRPDGGRRTRRRGLTVRVAHLLDRRGRDEQWHRDLASEDGRRSGDVAYVDQHPRAQVRAVERGDVLAQGAFVTRPAREVTERALLELLLGEPLVVEDVYGPRR